MERWCNPAPYPIPPYTTDGLRRGRPESRAVRVHGGIRFRVIPHPHARVEPNPVQRRERIIRVNETALGAFEMV